MTTAQAAAASTALDMDSTNRSTSSAHGTNGSNEEEDDALLATTLADVIEHDVDGEEILAASTPPVENANDGTAKFGRRMPLSPSSSPSDAYCEILSVALEKTTACTSLSSCLLVDDAIDDNSSDVSGTVVPLLKDLKKDGKVRSVAIQKLYRMTDRERQRNRLPMICTTKFNLVRELLPCLAKEAGAADRRRALLLLTNVAIPAENKAVMLLSETVDDLLPALLRIIRGRWNESYLAAACLFNLSYLGDAKPKLVRYVAAHLEKEDEDRSPALSYEFHLPEDNPCSLLRILESLLKEYVGFVGAPSVDVPASVQREAVRWSMATLRNLVTNAPDNAIVVGNKTDVPSLAVTCLDLTDRELVLWSLESLEDSCLMLLAHVAVHPECRESLLRLLPDLDRVVAKQLRGKGGIHEVRAHAILSHLKEDVALPVGTISASPHGGEPSVIMVTTTVI